MNLLIRKLLLKNKFWHPFILKGGMQNPEKKIMEREYDGEKFIIESFTEDGYTEYYIKNLRYDCFYFSLSKDNYATIMSLGNNENCVKKSHNNKIGAIMFIIFKEKNITDFEFMDNSELINNRFNLADLYYLKYGKTWYDKMIGLFAEKYTMDFKENIFPITYQDVKNKHAEIIGDTLKNKDFSEINKKKKEYFELLGLNRLTGITFIVHIIKWKNN
jgi:hypothetical protein